MTWREVVQRITFRFPFPITVTAELDDMRDGERLRVAMLVPDIHTGEKTHVYLADNDPPHLEEVHPDRRAFYAYRYIRAMVLRGLEHELDECLLVDGKQAVDPHANDPRPT